MTQMTPDHRGITSYPSSISNRASSIDSDDCGLSVYVNSSKQQDFDACSTVSSTDVDVSSVAASSSFDFDLDLLPVLADCQVPSLELPFPELDKSKNSGSCNSFCAEEDFIGSCCGLSQQVPSPSNTLSPIPHAHSPTMFSPGGGGGGGDSSSSCKAATAPTNTSTKYSPYAAAASEAASRTAGGRRLSSADSVRTTASSSSVGPPPVPQQAPQFSLLESLAEFNALQNRIKVERESAGANSPPPPPPPSYAESTSGKAATVKAEPGHPTTAMATAGPSSSSSTMPMPPPPYSYYGGCVIKSEAASVSDTEMGEGESAAAASFGRMDPVLSLVMEQARKDIDFTCSALSISNGEYRVVLSSITPSFHGHSVSRHH